MTASRISVSVAMCDLLSNEFCEPGTSAMEVHPRRARAATETARDVIDREVIDDRERHDRPLRRRERTKQFHDRHDALIAAGTDLAAVRERFELFAPAATGPTTQCQTNGNRMNPRAGTFGAGHIAPTRPRLRERL